MIGLEAIASTIAMTAVVPALVSLLGRLLKSWARRSDGDLEVTLKSGEKVELKIPSDATSAELTKALNKIIEDSEKDRTKGKAG